MVQSQIRSKGLSAVRKVTWMLWHLLYGKRRFRHKFYLRAPLDSMQIFLMICVSTQRLDSWTRRFC